MNSQFKNSNLGFYLYALIIFAVAVVTILIFWFMLSGYRIGTYDEDTILGSVYLGGLHEEEVGAKVEQKYVEWLDDETIVFELTYQGYSYQFDRELFSFNVALSTYGMVEGQTNELIVEYQASGTDRQDTIDEILALPFLANVSDNIDIETLINDVLNDAGLMKTYSLKKVEDYLVDESASTEIISTVDIDLPDGVNAADVVDSIVAIYGDEYIDLESKMLFDIVDELGSLLNDSEMTILSTGMLKLSHDTNFSIHEVHPVTLIDFTVYTLDNYPNFGSNTKVNRIADNSFSFFNPNNSDYQIKVEDLGSGNLRLTLYGLSFVNTITTDLGPSSKQLIKYITVETPDDTKLQNGHDGMIVIVHKTITNLDDEIVSEQDVLFEFYPPIKEIILEPIG